MSKPKRYYWMKLKESFMSSDTIDYFMSQPGGANYVVLYQMLCLKTINTNGRLSRQIGEIIIPYDVSKIQRDTKWFSIDTVRTALNLYKMAGLIYEDVDGTLVLSGHTELVGSETESSSRMRKLRNKPSQTALEEPSQCDADCDAPVPLRYNYDKPEKPRRIKGFEVFSLVFSSFSKPKNHTEISRIIGGVSLTTNE